MNIRKISILSKFKTIVVKLMYGKSLKTNGYIRILGDLPSIKLPKNASIYIGEKVVLNSDHRNSNTALTSNCTLVCGLNGVIEINDNTQLNGVSITAYKRVTIGKNCQIASNTFISDTDFHPTDPKLRERECLGYTFDHSSVNKKEVKIEDNVWIGWGVIVLKGVTIGKNSIIAAGSVVLKDIPPNTLVGGNPATIIKMI